MNKKALAAVAAIPFVLVAAGCTKSQSSHSVAIPSYHASAIANVPGFTNGKADDEKMLVNAGVPVHGSTVQQVQFIQSLKDKGNRQALAVKLGIPKSNRQAFYAAVLGDLERDHVATHAGRVQFLTDLENQVAQYQ